ncbi:MAG: hypothetical protein ACREQ4_07060 [Candidatus Binataceae bacterium]
MRDSREFEKKGISDRLRNLIVLCVVIVIVVLAYFGAKWDNAFNTSDKATIFAQEVIRNSPVVDQQIGWVTSVKQTSERYTSEREPKVLLDFDVTGRNGQGTVSIVLQRVNNNIWSMPQANMKVGTQDIALREAPPSKAPRPMAMD